MTIDHHHWNKNSFYNWLKPWKNVGWTITNRQHCFSFIMASFFAISELRYVCFVWDASRGHWLDNVVHPHARVWPQMAATALHLPWSVRREESGKGGIKPDRRPLKWSQLTWIKTQRSGGNKFCTANGRFMKKSHFWKLSFFRVIRTTLYKWIKWWK